MTEMNNGLNKIDRYEENTVSNLPRRHRIGAIWGLILDRKSVV